MAVKQICMGDTTFMSDNCETWKIKVREQLYKKAILLQEKDTTRKGEHSYVAKTSLLNYYY